MTTKPTPSQIRAMITQDMIKCASLVVAAKAMVQTIAPIVKGYQREILTKRQFLNEGAVKRTELAAVKRGVAPIVIPSALVLDPKDSYQLSDDDFQTYLADCKIEQAKNGLVTETPEQCPLLVAESNYREARNLFLDSMAPITGMDSSRILNTKSGVDNLEKMAEYSLRLLGSLGLVEALKIN